MLPLSEIYYPLYLNTLTILSPDFLLLTYASAILHEVQRQGRRRTWRVPLHQIPPNSEVKFFLFPSVYINVLLSIYYVCLPQPVGKDKYTFVHLLKESSYPLLNALPINPIHCITHMLRSLIWISCALSYGARLSFSSMPRCCKNTKNIQKSDYMDGFCLQGELDLTLFIS